MEVAVIIPARYDSSRFPGKPLVQIAGRSLISRVWSQCIMAYSKDCVFVATDDDRIYGHCIKNGMKVLMTSKTCLTGTDRVFEAAQQVEADIYVDVQGDEPLVCPADIWKLGRRHLEFKGAVHYGMSPITNEEDFRSPSVPKVVFDRDGYLLYASRAPIPTTKKFEFREAWCQTCVSSFSREHLETFSTFGRKTPLEEIEDIEILRMLELGFRVKMMKLKSTIAVDCPEDIGRVEAAIAKEKADLE